MGCKVLLKLGDEIQKGRGGEGERFFLFDAIHRAAAKNRGCRLLMCGVIYLVVCGFKIESCSHGGWWFVNKLL